MWFEKLTGFKEESASQVRANLVLEGETLMSKVTGKSFNCGSLSTPNLSELRMQVQSLQLPKARLSFSEVVADVQALHINTDNADSLFQVASQFNLLEMVSPDVSPEQGISAYEDDHTQGPACAIAAGAGTLFRNYFVAVNGKLGQSSHRQINTLSDLGQVLGNRSNELWQMKNGYVLASEEGLKVISERLMNMSESEIDALRQLLRIGIHQDTEVTISDAKHKVTQAYCSALAVSYSSLPPELWSRFASLVLEASYESTICAGILNAARTGNNKVFLTLLGGGAFGNDSHWITSSIERVLRLYKYANLDVYMVSYGASNNHVKALVNTFKIGVPKFEEV